MARQSSQMAVKDQQQPFASHVDERDGIAARVEKLQALDGDFFHGVINPEQPAAILYIPAKTRRRFYLECSGQTKRGAPT